MGSIENGSKEEGSTNISGKFLETTNLKEFSYEDLKVATKNFKSDALLGEGGFGKVYKGWLNSETLTPTKAGSGMIVAIKKLKSDSVQGVQEWQVSYKYSIYKTRTHKHSYHFTQMTQPLI
jgi:serine/threonine protein kinase